MTGPEKAGFQFGRSGFAVFPSPDRLLPVKGPKGKPLSAVKMELICQPLTSLFQAAPAPFKKRLFLPMGNSYPPLRTNWFF